MKKIMIFAAAIASLAACSKEAETVVDANHFEKGQKVTLSVKAGEPSTKVSSELNTSTGAIDFKWEKDDVIKVTVGSAYAEFTLKGDGGSNEGYFEGEMPAAGEYFDVQYPYGGVEESALASQTYPSDEAMPHDKMLFTAEDCELSKMTFELTAQYSALQLNLYGSKAVGSIVVETNETPAKTYTLDCKGTGSTGTEPGKTNEPKPFYIVVPAGTYGFTVTIKDVNSDVISSKSTTSDQTFAVNEFLKMPPLGYPGTDEPAVKIGSVTWAPVNCGYVAKTGDSRDAWGYPYGRFYQWGRKYGQGNRDSDCDYPGKGENQSAEEISSALESHPDGDNYNGKFYYGSENLLNWYGGTDKDDLWGETKTNYDPCPTGWRVPTKTELKDLIGGNSSPALVTNAAGQSGCYFNGTSSASSGVFLPAAGLHMNDNGTNTTCFGECGYYWSSSVSGDKAWFLFFQDSEEYINDSDCSRVYGCYVRCVQE